MQAYSAKIPLAGIKLSNELFLIRLSSSSSSVDTRSALCQILAENRINIQFLTGSAPGELSAVTGCVAAKYRARVKELLLAGVGFEAKPEFVSSVGLLSLFPHRASLKILGLSLLALGKSGVPIYAMASSLSVLSFITDYARLLEATKALKEYFDLPPEPITIPRSNNGTQQEMSS
ncbi:MAG: hypothetical protein JRI81_10925 [Deltaproteobacteria bacterium]|nr:hypothetical protein [Deltaproteobacteria bacterium]